MKKFLVIFIGAILLFSLIIIINFFPGDINNVNSFETVDIIEVNDEYNDIKIKYLTDEEMTEKLLVLGVSMEEIESKILSKEESHNAYLSKIIKISDYYQPNVGFYCSIENINDRVLIKDIHSDDLDKYYNEISKEFGGSLHYHLIRDSQIHFNLNGNFFDSGNTSALKEGTRMNFSVTNFGEKYKYVNIKDDIFLE